MVNLVIMVIMVAMTIMGIMVSMVIRTDRTDRKDRVDMRDRTDRTVKIDKIDQQSLRHVDVEAERVGAGQHEERDGQQQQCQGKFTWRQNILFVALE